MGGSCIASQKYSLTEFDMVSVLCNISYNRFKGNTHCKIDCIIYMMLFMYFNIENHNYTLSEKQRHFANNLEGIYLNFTRNFYLTNENNTVKLACFNYWENTIQFWIYLQNFDSFMNLELSLSNSEYFERHSYVCWMTFKWISIVVFKLHSSIYYRNIYEYIDKR